MQDAAGGALAADATLIAPGTGAFSIWSFIYFGLLAYAVWQFLPAQRTAARHRRLGYPVAASLLLNAAWILSIQFDLLWLSVPIIVALLVVLVVAFRICLAMPPRNLLDTIVTDGTVGLYLGWVIVATAANITAALVAAGWDGWGIPPETWAVMVVALAGLVGIALAVWDRGRIAPTLSLGWGLAWIAVARLTDAPHVDRRGHHRDRGGDRGRPRDRRRARRGRAAPPPRRGRARLSGPPPHRSPGGPRPRRSRRAPHFLRTGNPSSRTSVLRYFGTSVLRYRNSGA